jgi:hypothetical protein
VNVPAVEPGSRSDSPGVMLDELSQSLIGEKLRPDTRKAILDKTESLSRSPWNPQLQRKRLALMTSLILASPEFQRR